MGPCRARHPSDIINHCLLPSLEKSLLATLFHPLTCRNTQNIYTYIQLHLLQIWGYFQMLPILWCSAGVKSWIFYVSPLLWAYSFRCVTRSDTFAWLRPLVFLKLKIGWTLGTAERRYQSSLKAFCFFYNDSCSCLMLWVHYWKGRNSFTVIFTLIQFVMQLQKPRVWKAPYKTR